MNDVLWFSIAPFTLIFLYLLGKLFDALSDCWHKWDKWIVWQTDHAYCQGRKCTKCGQQQVIQTRKMEAKDGHTNG